MDGIMLISVPEIISQAMPFVIPFAASLIILTIILAAAFLLLVFILKKAAGFAVKLFIIGFILAILISIAVAAFLIIARPFG